MLLGDWGRKSRCILCLCRSLRICARLQPWCSVVALRPVVIAENVFWVFGWKHVDSVARARASILLPRSCIPPHCAEKTDKGCHTDGVVHVVWSDRLDGREEEDDTDEYDPYYCNRIDWFAPPAHRVWSRVEDNSAFIPSVGNDDSDVADVQGRCGDVEYRRDGQSASNADQIEAAAKDYDEPDCVYGGMREPVDLAPETMHCQLNPLASIRLGNSLGEWESCITSKGPGHSCICQHSRATGEELD